jgi:hypothetical protein
MKSADEVGTTAPAPGSYLEWNDALAAKFFRAELAGKEVILFLSDDVLDEIGGVGSRNAFIKAVLKGPSWVDDRLGLCQKALKSFEGWRELALKYPPYVAYLALFVLAANLEGPFAAHAYYPRLRALLGWPDGHGGAPPSFDRMLDLWEDLEVWSNRDMEGRLGVFSIRIAGEWIHVGLPKAQAVLTDQERRSLPSIFSNANLDPTSLPPDFELARVLRRFGTQTLRAHTLSVLANKAGEEEARVLLLDAIRQELEDWDGETTSDTSESPASRVYAAARICLRIDPTLRRVVGSVRVATKADFPEEGLTFRNSNTGDSFSCEEHLPGWSSPLRHVEAKQSLDPCALPWDHATEFVDPQANWIARLSEARIRIFVSGLPYELPGLVEVRSLPRSRPFTLVASKPVLGFLATWRESGQVNLSESDVRDGLPQDWTLFTSLGAQSDEAIRRTVPELTLATEVRILFQGGIRSGQGNAFFEFAAPSIVVEGGSGEEIVCCNGEQLDSIPTGSTFPLPSNLEAGSQLLIEVKRGTEVVRRQSLFLSNLYDWNLRTPLAALDRFGFAGEWTKPMDGLVAGAMGGGQSSQSFPIRPQIVGSRRVFAIGARIGEIVTAVNGGLPVDWHPVWLVTLGRRGYAEYCGLSLKTDHPIDTIVGSREDQDLWKEILSRRRRRIDPPQHPVLRRLWGEYSDFAASV